MSSFLLCNSQQGPTASRGPTLTPVELKLWQHLWLQKIGDSTPLWVLFLLNPINLFLSEQLPCGGLLLCSEGEEVLSEVRGLLSCSQAQNFLSKKDLPPHPGEGSGWFSAPTWVFSADNLITSPEAGLELMDVEDNIIFLLPFCLPDFYFFN